MINALLGGDILPSDYGEVTSNVSCIEGVTMERIRVTVADSSRHEKDRVELGR